jgi:hypothetical protein
MIETPEQSAVLDLLDTVWNHWGKATRHCWDRINHSMQKALSVAIGSGMKFGPDDFSQIQRRYRFHYWGGNDRGGFAEGFYGLAVTEGNISAAQAFEKWKGRPPFILDWVRPNRGAHYVHRVGIRERGRVAVGFEFLWHGHMVTVTSFAADGSYLTACRYKRDDEERGYARRKIENRFTITPADIRAYRRVLKQSA